MRTLSGEEYEVVIRAIEGGLIDDLLSEEVAVETAELDWEAEQPLLRDLVRREVERFSGVVGRPLILASPSKIWAAAGRRRSAIKGR